MLDFARTKTDGRNFHNLSSAVRWCRPLWGLRSYCVAGMDSDRRFRPIFYDTAHRQMKQRTQLANKQVEGLCVFGYLSHKLADEIGRLVKWKQRYFKKVGDEYYVHSAQWDVTHHKWHPYFVKDDW
jgi:hypothetical protein